MNNTLNAAQLRTVLENGPLFDGIAPIIPWPANQQLLAFQQRAGNAYNGGDWTITNTGQTISNPPADAPTRDEAQQALGQAYLALDEKRVQLKGVMDKLQLTPTAQKSWAQWAVDGVAGIFR